nr:unnamed protein product [Callosobruchus chinensis]CAH7727248.1 unnamed protein product [Callosobruchus chinensis]CAH7732096.1 unnamed protein product [Callosobruchus chinensis]CAH7736633.1 unnamed protein product [Callosobruchus chinensis]CAH7751620.1 unnamed protein product [Callosobruchus chinensis]
MILLDLTEGPGAEEWLFI